MIGLKKDLTNIIGIGETKANELIKAGIKKVKDLSIEKYNNMLSDTTRKLLLYKPISKIPYNDIKQIEPLILSFCDYKSGCISIIIVGSYRRKLPFSQDIDVMIISDNENILSAILTKMVNLFGQENVIPYAIGKEKISLLIDLKGISKHVMYKFDLFRSTIKKSHAMLLYSTGSKEHNIMMRQKAKKLGLLLNQDGLYNRQTGKLIQTNSERDIFDKLHLEYKEPWDRN